MSRHLSGEEISAWMAGERSPEHAGHLRECPECAKQVATVEETLTLFRHSAHQWSEPLAEKSMLAFLPATRPTPARFRLSRFTLAISAVALLIVALIPAYLSVRAPHSAPVAVQTDAWLEQVDADVSRTVPQPMQPLLELIAADTANSATAGDGPVVKSRRDTHETAEKD